MATYIDGSHNMLFTMDAARWEADLAKSSLADIVGYQEAEQANARTALKTHCEKNNRGRFHPTSCGNPISWKKEKFTPITGQRGVIEVHKGHPTEKYHPARDIAWIGLTHIETKYRVLRINIHPTAGATRPQSGTPWSDDLDAWKDRTLANYYLDLLSFTAAQLSREYWHVISLGGDYNGALDNLQAWYYPGRMLPAVYRADAKPQGLDHLQSAHGSDVRDGKRWTVKINSDHDLHLVRRAFVKKTNYPAVM